MNNNIDKAWSIRYKNTNEAIKIAKQIIDDSDDIKLQNYAKLVIIYCDFINDNIKNILTRAYEVYSFFEKYPKSKEFILSQILTARIYNKYRDFDNAQKHIEIAINKAIESDNKSELANSYTTLGIIEKSKQNFDTAIEYFQKALKIRQDKEQKFAISSSLNLIARTYLKAGKTEQAIEYFYKNIEIKQNIDDYDGLQYTYIDLADAYGKNNNFDKEIEYLKKVIDSKNQKAKMIANYKLGKIFLYANKLNQAEQYIFNAKQIAEKIQNDKYNILVTSIISDYYKQTNNVSKAFEFFEEYHKLQNKKNKEDNDNRYNNLNEEYEIHQKIKNKELQLAYKNIEEKNKDILDSIKYAYRIQNAILPPEYLVKRLLPDSFILYKPKDVVSGDFYFVSEFHDKVVFSAVDCTGHGVPGALVSVIGYNWLVQGVREKNVVTPGELLSFLDEGVNDTLRQTADESGVKDSMDLAVCTIDFKTNTLMYAGAYNPCYYIHKGELFEIKADKLPIGVNVDGVVDIYTDHTIKLEKGDTVYIFSDGYADQFGGSRNKKFKYRQLKEKIMEMQHLSMDEQRDFLDKTLIEWQGNEEQIDDILVMGVKI